MRVDNAILASRAADSGLMLNLSGFQNDFQSFFVAVLYFLPVIP